MTLLRETIEIHFEGALFTVRVVDLVMYGVVIEVSSELQLLSEANNKSSALQVGSPALIKIPESWSPFCKDPDEKRSVYLASTRRLCRSLFHYVLCFDKLSPEEQRDFRALIRRLK